MRVWDVSPGYLSRQSLLGEHREIHGLHQIVVHGKTGYSRHPETTRWVGFMPALARRHAALVAEMQMRGYVHQSPMTARGVVLWPDEFVTAPIEQLQRLDAKYGAATTGRIPLPRNPQELWAHHKYSVMARDPAAYAELGRRVSRLRRGTDYAPLVAELVTFLRAAPAGHRLVNALEHMWGYVAREATAAEVRAARRSARGLLAVTCLVAHRTRQPYLLASTALSDLAIFLRRTRTATPGGASVMR